MVRSGQGRSDRVIYAPIHAEFLPSPQVVASRAIPSAFALVAHTQLPSSTPFPRTDTPDNEEVCALFRSQSVPSVYNVA